MNNQEFNNRIEESDDSLEKDEKKLSKLGLSLEDIEDLEGHKESGTTALVYFIGDNDNKMVVKKGIDTDNNLGSKREYAFLKLLKLRNGNKISPDPYYYNPESDVLVMEKIEGEQLTELSESDLRKVAQAIAEVHGPEFTRPGVPFQKRNEATQYDNLIDQIKFLNDVFEETSEIIKDELGNDALVTLEKAKESLIKKAEESQDDFNKSSFSLIHYDLNPDNILKEEDGNILFLDWRQAMIGDRAMDVAKFFYKNYLDEEQQKVFFEEYAEKINDPSIEKRVDIYYPLIRLVSLLWRLRFLNIDVKKHPKMSDNIDLELISERLKDDYKYLLSQLNSLDNK